MNICKKRSNRWLTLLLCLMFCTLSHAQAIHWITFIDTSDWQLGADNKNGKRALDTHLIQRVNAALLQKGYTPRYYNYTGNSVTAAICNSVTSSLSCGPRDIVVFYYIGHGGRPTKEKDGGGSVWPEMEFVGQNHNYLSLGTIHQRLKSKNPQLLLTIGMCCNIPRSSHDQNEGLTAQSRKNNIVNKDFAKKLQNLFAGHRGDIIVAAASAGQEAQGGFRAAEGEMDYFTGTLCSLMDSYAVAPSNEVLTWNKILNDLSYWTSYYVKKECGLVQTPYKVNNARPIQ